MRELSSGTHSHRWCLLAPKPPTPSELPPGAHLHPHLIDLQLQSPEPSPGAHLLRHFIDLKPQSIEPRALLAPKNLRAISILTCLHQAFRATSRHTSRSICWSSLFPACVHGCTTCGIKKILLLPNHSFQCLIAFQCWTQAQQLWSR
eukprot:1160745-Pelagomonas_calceolata.AAC.3